MFQCVHHWQLACYRKMYPDLSLFFKAGCRLTKWPLVFFRMKVELRSDASSDVGAGVGNIVTPDKHGGKANASNTEALLRKIEGLQMIVDVKDRELAQAKEEVALVSKTDADTEFTAELKNRILEMTKKNRELQNKMRSKEAKQSEVEQRLKKLEAERLDRLKCD